jgi:hypothetical protein
MNDITLNTNKDCTLNKLKKIKFYRTCTFIKNDIQDYIIAETYQIFSYQKIKNDLSRILDKYKVKYELEYIYDLKHNEIKINFDDIFKLDITFNYEKYQY